jgi:hypothetical protein
VRRHAGVPDGSSDHRVAQIEDVRRDLFGCGVAHPIRHAARGITLVRKTRICERLTDLIEQLAVFG